MRCWLAFVLVTCLIAPLARGVVEFPKPSPYPKTWELKFEHGKPTRVVVPDAAGAQRAYWYMTYSVTNDTDRERLFLPSFELVTEDGRVIRNDINIPKNVFTAIKGREGSRFLEPAALIGGQLRIGKDQAKDGVAIWPERRRLWPLYVLTVVYAASVILFFVVARYRHPLVPFVMIFAAAGVVRAPDLLRTLRPAHHLEIEPGGTVRRGGREIHLTPHEEALLRYLAAHPRQLIRRDRLLRDVWGLGFDPGTNVPF